MASVGIKLPFSLKDKVISWLKDAHYTLTYAHIIKYLLKAKSYYLLKFKHIPESMFATTLGYLG